MVFDCRISDFPQGDTGPASLIHSFLKVMSEELLARQNHGYIHSLTLYHLLGCSWSQPLCNLD